MVKVGIHCTVQKFKSAVLLIKDIQATQDLQPSCVEELHTTIDVVSWEDKSHHLSLRVSSTNLEMCVLSVAESLQVNMSSGTG